MPAHSGVRQGGTANGATRAQESQTAAESDLTNNVRYKASGTLVKGDDCYVFTYSELGMPEPKTYHLYINPEPTTLQLEAIADKVTNLVELVRRRDPNFTSVTFAGGAVSPSNGVEYYVQVDGKRESRKLWDKTNFMIPGSNPPVAYHEEVKRVIDELKSRMQNFTMKFMEPPTP